MSETYDTFLDWIRNEILPGGMDHDPETVQRWQEELDEWLNSVKAEAWDECNDSIREWHRTYRDTLYTWPENPYKKEIE